MIKKRQSFNVGGLICLVAAVCFMSYVLLDGDILPCSITSVMSSMNHWARHWHILVVGFLPVYVALMLFGTAVFSIYAGSALQRWLTHLLHHQK